MAKPSIANIHNIKTRNVSLKSVLHTSKKLIVLHYQSSLWLNVQPAAISNNKFRGCVIRIIVEPQTGRIIVSGHRKFAKKRIVVTNMFKKWSVLNHKYSINYIGCYWVLLDAYKKFDKKLQAMTS